MTQDTTPKRGRPPNAEAQRQATYASITPFGRAWNATPVETRRLLASNRGLPAEVGDTTWQELTVDVRSLLQVGEPSPKETTIVLPMPKEELVILPADVLQAQIEALKKQVQNLNEQFIRLRNEYNVHVSHHDTPQMPSRGAVR